MATATQNRLFDSAKIRLPGALDAAVWLEYFLVCEEFLRETNAWKELIEFTATPATLTYIEAPEQYTFPLTLPTGSQAVSLFTVVDSSERVQKATMDIPGEIVLETPPAESTTLYAYVSLTVGEPTDLERLPQIPDWIEERHWPALLDGLLYRMMSQMGKPYTNTQMALMHGRRYNSRRSQARVEALRQNLYGAQTWSFPQSFNRR
jgi:hypothetical protein